MSSPAPSGRASALRVGGIALIGLAVVAAVIGLFSLAIGGGNGDGQTAAPPPSADATPGPGEPGGPATGAPPTTGDGTTPSPAPGDGTGTPPGDGSGAGAGGAGGPEGGAGAGGDAGTGGGAGAGGADPGNAGTGPDGAVTAPLRVYNNSTVSGLATRAADDFRSAGWPVREVANYPSGVIPTSTVYYSPGTSEQSSAQAMGSAFGLRVEPRFEGLTDAAPGLIVIVTNDYGTDAGTRK